MDNLKFMEIMGNIDTDLIREADTVPERKPVMRRYLAFAGSIAAAAVIAVGAGVYLHGAKPETQPPVQNTVTANTGAATTTAAETEQGVIAGGAVTEENGVFCGDYWVNTTDSGDALCGTYWVNPAETLPPDQLHAEPGTVGFAVTEAPEITAVTVQTESTAQTEITAQTVPAEMQQKTAPTGVQKGGVSADDCYYEAFKAAVNPDTDSFQEDEAYHVDIRTADGFYQQLLPDDYGTHGIKPEIAQDDFGAYIGKITETDTSDYHGNAAESQTPSLRGADVYYYAPAGKNKAFILVKQDKQCSIFIADRLNISEGFKKGFAFFNVQNAADIRCIEIEKRVPADGGRFASASLCTADDAETIEKFYDLLLSLVPEDYSKLPPHIGTPQWLQDAWEAYRQHPDSPREDYEITLILQDGTVLQHITYQPFLGNGYVSGMEELTPEQAETLHALLVK